MPNLLREFIAIEIDHGLIKESVAANKSISFPALLQRKDARNANGRIYPGRIMDREFERYNEMVKNRQAMGELDHPDSAIVNLNNVSHIISEQQWDGNNWMGKLEVLPTPSGNILKSLLLANVKLGVSSRGVGSVQTESATDVVQDDFEMICFDVVSTPSTGGAYIFKESRNIEDIRKNERGMYDQLVLNTLNDILKSNFRFK